MSEQDQNIALSEIDEDKQVREQTNEEADRALMASMREKGLGQDIGVRKRGVRYVVVYGHRRFKAARALGWKTISCKVFGELSDTDSMEWQLIENIQRENLALLDKAKGVVGLMEKTGWTGAATAKRLGMSPASVSKLAAILTLSPEVLAKVASGEICASAAYALTQAGDKLPELAAQAANGASRDAITGAVKQGKPKPEKPEVDEKPTKRVLCRLKDAAVTVSAKKLTIDTFIELLEGVLGQARKARTQGVEVATLARMFRDMAKGKQLHADVELEHVP
jgi:ParB family chromosome partitioning protein